MVFPTAVADTRLEMASTSELPIQQDVPTQDWSETLCSTPGIIFIIGESMMLASVPSAAQVRFTSANLSYVILCIRMALY